MKIQFEQGKGGEYQLVPEGWYQVRISRTREENVGSEKIPRLSFGMEIEGGDMDSRWVWANILVSKPSRDKITNALKQPSHFRLRELLHAADPERFEDPAIPEVGAVGELEIPQLRWFEGRRMFVKVTHRQYVPRSGPNTGIAQVSADARKFRSLAAGLPVDEGADAGSAVENTAGPAADNRGEEDDLPF